MATAKQLAARKRFAAIMKSGGFKKHEAKAAAKKTVAKRAKNPAKKATGLAKVLKKVERKIGIVRQKRRTNPLKYAVKMGSATSQKTVARCESKADAESYAKNLHRQYPSKHIKVVIE